VVTLFAVGDEVVWSAVGEEVSGIYREHIEPFTVVGCRWLHESVAEGRHPQLLELEDSTGKQMLGPFSGTFLVHL